MWMTVTKWIYLPVDRLMTSSISHEIVAAGEQNSNGNGEAHFDCGAFTQSHRHVMIDDDDEENGKLNSRRCVFRET